VRTRGGARDAGRVSVFVAIALTGILVLIGMVVDAGGKLRTHQRADNIAAEAARAAGQAIDPAQAIPGNAKVIDPIPAAAAAREYLSAAGVPGSVTILDQRRVEVVVTITRPTSMLSLIGIDSSTVTGRATAELVTG
jgi:Flp pilus assembly protein TadG